MPTILTPVDDGYQAIYSHYVRENYPDKFNYANDIWQKISDTPDFLKLTSKSGSSKIENFSGKGHEDRPFVAGTRG